MNLKQYKFTYQRSNTSKKLKIMLFNITGVDISLNGNIGDIKLQI